MGTAESPSAYEAYVVPEKPAVEALAALSKVLVRNGRRAYRVIVAAWTGYQQSHRIGFFCWSPSRFTIWA